MKSAFKLLLAAVFLFFIPVLFGQKKPLKTSWPLSVEKVEKSVVQVRGKIFAGKFEVTNEQYLQFIQYLIDNQELEKLQIAMPDTANWNQARVYGEPYLEFYFRHPSYSKYPVVNVTYEAANLFCRWMTDQYNSLPERKFRKVIFRLPTETEWEWAAAGNSNNDYPWGNNITENGRRLCNYFEIGDENIVYDTVSKEFRVNFKGFLTQPTGNMPKRQFITAVDMFKPNQFGLYNICGNVAEMTSQKGIAKGGSWKTPGGDVKVKARNVYTSSAIDLGFRYFMEIVE